MTKDRREYMKNYYEENKEYFKEHNQKFREENPDYMRDYMKEYYQAHKDQWPNYLEKGVFIYKLIDDSGECIRIGTTNCMSTRVGNYFSGNSLNGINKDILINKFRLKKILVIDLEELGVTRDEATILEYSWMRINGKPKLNSKEINIELTDIDILEEWTTYLEI